MQPGGILDWRLDEGKIASDQSLDGCYMIKTTVLKGQRRQTVSLCGTTFDQVTEPTADQARLLALLLAPPESTEKTPRSTM